MSPTAEALEWKSDMLMDILVNNSQHDAEAVNISAHMWNGIRALRIDAHRMIVQVCHKLLEVGAIYKLKIIP